jgi:hypothetical protein
LQDHQFDRLSDLEKELMQWLDASEMALPFRSRAISNHYGVRSPVIDTKFLNGLKAVYAAELSIATASELGIKALGLDIIARPIVDVQRLNAAAQNALWGGLIGFLNVKVKN